MDIIEQLIEPNETKIVLLVFDGLGDIDTGRGTPLEVARTPHLDQLAREGITGFHDPVGPGITPGSGPAHLGLFGYDPMSYEIGRGVLEALGVDFELRTGDVPARINFCTVDAQGKIVDRRAGRIPSEEGQRVCDKLRDIAIPRVAIHLRHVKEYRAAVVFRAPGLGGHVQDTDPQKTGVPPLPPALTEGFEDEGSRRTVQIAADFIDQARRRLAEEPKANMLMLRGFDLYEPLPPFKDRYGLRAAAIATYPMYKGVSRLVGMEVIEQGQETEEQQFDVLEEHWAEYDFFFVHIKKTDSYGEDGNFDGKRALIEKVDGLIPRLLALSPDVLAVTGDHSTPVALRSHSFHPVPLLIWSKNARVDPVQAFNEKALTAGGLGTIPAKELMTLLLAHALRLGKFGA